MIRSNARFSAEIENKHSGLGGAGLGLGEALRFGGDLQRS